MTVLYDSYGETALNYTIFDTPVLRTIFRWLSIFILKLSGWKTEGRLPEHPKFVLIAAPHTSNWDLPLMLFVAFALRAKIYWMGKETIFKHPFERLFKWLGGIPIDRSRSNNIVELSVEQFERNKKLILTVPPAGTRKKVMYWKTGFYHIAKNANVPIALGFLDYKRRMGGIGPLIHPTGNISEDMEIIRDFYKDITGCHPHKSIVSADIQTEFIP